MNDALRKLKEMKKGDYSVSKWEEDMKKEKLIEGRFAELICRKKGAWLYLDVIEDTEKFFDANYDKVPYAVIRKICEKLKKEGVCAP